MERGEDGRERAGRGRRPWHTGLGLRLRSAIFLVVVLAVPAVLLVHEARSQRADLVNAAQARVLEVARQIVARDDSTVDRARTLLTSFADLAATRPFDASLCDRMQAPSLREASWVLAGTFVRADGSAICNFGSHPNFPHDAATTRFLVQVAAGHGVQIDEIRFVGGGPLYLAALPVSNGADRAVLGLALNLGALVRASDEESSLEMLVLDRTGVVLLNTGAGGAVPGQRIQHHPMLPRLMIEAEGTGVGVDSAGISRIYAFTQLPATGAKFVVGIPRAIVLGALEADLRNGLFLLAGVSIVAVAFMWLVAEFTVFRWLDRLVRATRSVAGGDLAERVTVPSSSGEFSILAESFNEMTRRLGAREREVGEQRRAQQESEARFRDIAEIASDWFWELDPGNRVTYVSGRFDESSGAGAELVVGASIARIIELAAPDAAVAAFQAALQARRSFRNIVVRMVLPGEVTRYWRLSGKPIVDRAGAFAGFRGAGSDVTQEKAGEEALRAAKQAAEAANLAKSQFLANMSHELRTPLNAIIGFSEIIKAELFGTIEQQKYVEYIDDIHNSAHHLLAIINDILDLARVDMGKDSLSEEMFNLPDMVAAAVHVLEGRAAQSGIALGWTAADPGLVLYGDARRLTQAVLNLAGNAIKFTQMGGRVDVSVEVDAGGGPAIVVADTGIGIAPEDLAQVLRPFWQADTTLSRQRDGLGLGLTLTKEFVELHGGTLELSSELGRGTTATIRLPAWRRRGDVGTGTAG